MTTKKNRIIALRKERGLSQLDLANLLETTQQSVSRMEQGITALDDKRIAALSKAFNVPPANILEEALSADQDELMDLYQKMSESQRQAVLTLARSMVQG